MLLESGKLSAITVTGFTAVLASIGTAAGGEMTTWTHIMASVGLGGAIAIFLVRWLVQQHKAQADRVNSLTERMIQMIERSTEVNTRLGDTAEALVRSSHNRGEEVRLLITCLAARPCLALLLEKSEHGQLRDQLEKLQKDIVTTEEGAKR